MRKRIKDVTGSTITLNKNESGTLVVLDRAAGIAVTLPQPSRGLQYEFVVKTSSTTAANTGAYRVLLPDTGASIKGAVSSGVTNTAAKHQASAGVDTLVCGTANGGLIGSYYKLVCDNDKKWNVTGVAVGAADGSIFT